MTQQTETIRPDSKGRITLGKHAEGVSSYEVVFNADGSILLRPRSEVPSREVWLFKNPRALQAVKRGLDDAAAGRVVRGHSFAEYADADVDD
jgi:hypothetical protein